MKFKYSLNKTKNPLFGLLSLLGSSFISAIGFILLASNRWSVLEPSVIVQVILYVQWQTFGLTISKIGIEQVVFAGVSKDESMYFNATKYIFKLVLPLGGVFALIVSFVLSPWAAIVTFVTILLDTYSLIIMADLNARKFYAITSIANLLNYPLFFLVIHIYTFFVKLQTNGILIIFLLSSTARVLWLVKNQYNRSDLKEVSCNVSIEMGIQQVFNYILFRIDQITLGTLAFSMNFPALNQDFIREYVFMAKFPELISAVMVIAGTVLLPKLFIKYPFEINSLIYQFKKYCGLILSFILSILILLIGYLSIWDGNSIQWFFVIPFLFHSICIFPANIITYSMLRQGYLYGLLRNLSVSILVGMVIIIFVRLQTQVEYLFWVVPVQLLIFIFLTFIISWGKKRNIWVENYD